MIIISINERFGVEQAYVARIVGNLNLDSNLFVFCAKAKQFN